MSMDELERLRAAVENIQKPCVRDGCDEYAMFCKHHGNEDSIERLRDENAVLRGEIDAPGGTDGSLRLHTTLHLQRMKLLKEHHRLVNKLVAVERENVALRRVVRFVADVEHDCFEQDCPECGLRRIARAALRDAGGTGEGEK